MKNRFLILLVLIIGISYFLGIFFKDFNELIVDDDIQKIETKQAKSPITFNFVLSNQWFTSIHIDTIIVRCSCVIPHNHHKNIKPFSKNNLSVLYSPSKKGFFVQEIDIYYNHKQNPKRVYLQVDVK